MPAGGHLFPTSQGNDRDLRPGNGRIKFPLVCITCRDVQLTNVLRLSVNIWLNLHLSSTINYTKLNNDKCNATSSYFGKIATMLITIIRLLSKPNKNEYNKIIEDYVCICPDNVVSLSESNK